MSLRRAFSRFEEGVTRQKWGFKLGLTMVQEWFKKGLK